MRKAPTPAIGFRVAASKWLILVRLLLGEVPERQEFALPGLGKSLQPYLELTQAVGSGDLVTFAEVNTLGFNLIYPVFSLLMTRSLLRCLPIVP